MIPNASEINRGFLLSGLYLPPLSFYGCNKLNTGPPPNNLERPRRDIETLSQFLAHPFRIHTPANYRTVVADASLGRGLIRPSGRVQRAPHVPFSLC